MNAAVGDRPATELDDASLGAEAEGSAPSDEFSSFLRHAARVSEPQYSREATLSVGMSLAGGRLSVRRRIGAGGMGSVYEAFDSDRMARVALKTLNRLDAPGMYQLKNEFRALADVTHRNLVSLYELFAEGENCFFTMELVEGEHFDRWVRPDASEIGHSSLDEARLRAALQQLVAAVLAIHGAGKLHRDLKPSNVLVTNDGRVVVLDFGLAVDRELGGIGQTLADQAVSGTPGYMAPEQAAGAPASSASDAYAIGVMLFEALTGRLPFEGGVHNMLLRKQHFPAPAPTSFTSSIPQDLDAICQALVTRDAAQRPTLSELASRLDPVTPTSDKPLLAAASASVVPELLGRAAELAQLRAAFEASCRPCKPVILLLAGPSGIGKSALVEALLASIRQEGHALVLSGRCFERESVPYKAFDAVADELSRHLRKLSGAQVHALLPRDAFALRKLFPVLGRIAEIAEAPVREVPDAHELRRRAFLAFGELLGRIRDRQPLVLHLDDLQWSDADSTVLLMHLVRQPDAPRLLLIASHRSEQMRSHPCLAPLYDELRVDVRLDLRQMELGPLSDEAARALLQRQFAHASAELVAEAAGNPFLLGELARHAAAHPGRPGAGHSLFSLVVARADTLSVEERRLLEVLAVAGRPVSLAIAAEAAGVSTGTRTVFESLRSKHLGRATGEAAQVECFHDQVREALLRRLSSDELRQHHMSLACALQRVPDVDPEHLAVHLLGAGELVRASEQLVLGAERASRELGFDRAARLYEQALEHGSFSIVRAHALRVARADALAEAGRGVAAAAAYLDALPGASAEEAIALSQRSAEQYFYGGQLELGLGQLTAAFAAVGLRLPKSTPEVVASIAYHEVRLRLRRYRWSGRPAADPRVARRIEVLRNSAHAMMRIDFARGAELGIRASLLELRSGSERDAAMALSRAVLTAALLGADTVAIDRAIARAVPLVMASSDPEVRALFYGFRAIARTTTRPRFDQGALVLDLEQCIEFCANRSVPESSHNLHLCELLLINTRAWGLSELAAVATQLPARIDDAWSRGDFCLVPLWCGELSAISSLAVGNDAAVEHNLTRARAIWPASHYSFQECEMDHADWRLEAYRGRTRAAWQSAQRSLSRLLRSPMARSNQAIARRIARDRCAAALAAALGPGSEKDALLGCVADSARHLQDPFHRLTLSAASACCKGDSEVAIASLRKAKAVGAMGLDENALSWRLGALLGGDEGKALTAEADRFFRKAGVVDVERYVTMLAPGLEIR